MTRSAPASTSVEPGAHRSVVAVWARAALAVAAKDALCEARARHALAALGLFAITSTVAVSFVLSAWGSESEVAAALLWIIIYFSATSGLGRSFAREEETGTADVLKLSAPPAAVYFGKLAFNFGTMLALLTVLAPIFVVLMGCPVADWRLFAVVLFVGSMSLVAGTTIAAAMVARAASRGALLAVICFPVLLPVLVAAIEGTDAALGGGSRAAALSCVRLLIYYCGVVVTASLMLFRHVWED